MYTDADGDGYGDENSLGTPSCTTDRSGLALTNDDCNDDASDKAAPAIHPGAQEVCDDIDNNCDLIVDSDATDRIMFYRDGDGDGYGNSDISQQTCKPEKFFTSTGGGDCDDNRGDIYPGAIERCPGDPGENEIGNVS